VATFQADQAVRYGFPGGVYGRIKVSIFTTWISLLRVKGKGTADGGFSHLMQQQKPAGHSTYLAGAK